MPGSSELLCKWPFSGSARFGIVGSLFCNYSITTSTHARSNIPHFNQATVLCRSKSILKTPSRSSSTRSLSTSIKRASASPPSKVQAKIGNSSQSSPLKRALSQNIIITGGTSGIGFAVAQQALLEGASRVRIVTRDAQRAKAAIAKLCETTATQGQLDYVEAEAHEYADSKLFHDIENANNSPFTTAIHCAGTSQTSLLTSTRAEDIHKILSVNLESSALLSKTLLKRYMQTCMNLNKHKSSTLQPSSHGWQLINISSLLALKAGQGSSIYAASKAGLIALTRAIALEGAEISKRYADVAPGFRANVVVPGYIETPMTHNISGRSRERLLEQIPLGRFGSPGEVADAVMFLLGNQYANNCVLNLDGGLSAV